MSGYMIVVGDGFGEPEVESESSIGRVRTRLRELLSKPRGYLSPENEMLLGSWNGDEYRSFAADDGFLVSVFTMLH